LIAVDCCCRPRKVVKRLDIAGVRRIALGGSALHLRGTPAGTSCGVLAAVAEVRI